MIRLTASTRLIFAFVCGAAGFPEAQVPREPASGSVDTSRPDVTAAAEDSLDKSKTHSKVGLFTGEMPASPATGDSASAKSGQYDLEMVKVSGRARRFADKNSEHVARMPLANLENPQVYSTVGKELIQDQMVTNLDDAMRNVPGVMPLAFGAGIPAMMSRGFQTGATLRNGMATNLKSSVDPVNFERLEAIKGPSATLFGSSLSSYGGIFNYVTKKPYDSFGGDVSFASGSWDLSRFSADVNTPLNAEKTALLRVNAARQNENSFQDAGYTHTYALAPSFLYKVNDRLTLSLDGELQSRKGTSISYAIGNGVGIASFDDLPLAYGLSLADNSIDNDQISSNLAAQAEFRINDNWISQTNYAWSNGAYYDFNYMNLTWINDSSVTRSVNRFAPDKIGRKQIQQNFVGTSQWGEFGNKLLLGVDFMNDYRILRIASIFNDTVIVNRPAGNFGIDRIEARSAAANFPTTQTIQNYYGAYLSDVIDWDGRVMAMLSLRIDRFDGRGTRNSLTGQTTGIYEQDALSPKLGLVYQPVKKQVALFANYMNAFRNVAPGTQPDGTISEFKPQEANQWEVGVKLDLFDNRLSATVSYYDIQVENVVRNEVDRPTFTVQDGTQESKGYEAELIANPLGGLDIVAGYGRNENKFVKAAPAVQGKSAVNTPEDMANIWISYRFTKGPAAGLGAGAGGSYISNSWFNSANTFILPDYTLVNAALFYDHPKYRVNLKANNLLDEEYWQPEGRPQKPLNFMGGVTLKF